MYSDICDHLQFLSKALSSLNTNQGNAVALRCLSDFKVHQKGGCGLGFITSSPHYNTGVFLGLWFQTQSQ